MKHLVIGQRQNAPNVSAFHWSPHGSLVSIGQHFVTTIGWPGGAIALGKLPVPGRPTILFTIGQGLLRLQ